MAVDRIIVDALVSKFEGNPEGLAALQSTVLDAYIARRSVNITISSSSGDFGAASGIDLAPGNAQRDFLECIAAALAEINDEAPVATARAAVMDFSCRRTEL